MPIDYPRESPEAAFGESSNNDIMMMLAHPKWGLGALTSAVQVLDGRVENVATSLESTNDEVKVLRGLVTSLDNRIPYTPAQADEERRELFRKEKRRQARRASLSTMRNKAFEHIGIVFGTVLAALLLGGNFWHAVVISLERLFHLETP